MKKKYLRLAIIVGVVLLYSALIIRNELNDSDHSQSQNVVANSGAPTSEPSDISSPSPQVEVSKEFIKGVHYFGNEWPVNFWSSDLSGAGNDFSKIKNDGFNTIILVIPWGEAQPHISPVSYNQDLFGRLKMLIEKADEKGLKVILRVGYAWDYSPDVEMSHVDRVRKLYTDPTVYNAWLDYIKEIYTQIKDYPNVTMGFITWEDFWGVVDEASNTTDPAARLEFSKEIGFQTFLKNKYTLSQVSEKYDSEFSTWDQVPTPERKSEAFALFYEFMDSEIVNRFFVPAQRVFPTLSMEARIDSDPIDMKDGSIYWYSHKDTYKLPGAVYTAGYYSPAMGAENNGNEDSAAEALKRQQDLFKTINQNLDGRLFFIDQFLYMDNTPAFNHNTKVKLSELNSFVEKSAAALNKYTNGYAIWNYRSYAASTVYNPSFALKDKGWLVSGEAQVVKNGDEDYSVLLSEGGTVGQSIPKQRDFYSGFGQNVKLSFIAKADKEPAKLSIKIGDEVVVKEVTPEVENYELEIPIDKLKDYNLSFSDLNGEVQIDDIKLYSFIQEGNVYDFEGNQGSALTAFRNLNSNSGKQQKKLNGFDANAKWDETLEGSTSVLKGSYQIEGDSGSKYAWVGQVSKIQLEVTPNSSIDIKGSVPVSLYKKSNSQFKELKVDIVINDKIIASQAFVEDGELSFHIDKEQIKKVIGESTSVQLTLQANSAVNPAKAGIGKDTRDLSFIINSINVT
ncbi:glycoside hydrolase family 5 protein [Paenibacillus rhizovicinus]|uniref:Glycoside hydrolase family 5 protein n=1 Tax=Paenibacillus rhizovicinus TaxID=2704463 RepID=A0A6C0NZ81_9BACL|nr:cellulase family glycosylhydrolase [Paenibacillus rhizovicinus]QHW31545.1 glycoside hydrolase family 5 protein [Paenibacillus rhizovicinus]